MNTDSVLRSSLCYEGLGICGVDEVGRGALAGPVLAAAVILPLRTGFPESLKSHITDSKQISAKNREVLAQKIIQYGIVSVGSAEVHEIERWNILHATLVAMERAVEGLSFVPEVALIDGKYVPRVSCRTIPVIQGDRLSIVISAASIVAKVTRDRIMAELAIDYPYFGWEHNAGYPTKTHKQALLVHGLTKHHRRTFAPVRKIVCQKAKRQHP